MINFFKAPAALLAAVLALAACAGPTEVSRNAPFDITPVIDVPTQDWTLAGLTVNVPQSLTVSEANTIKPFADIVWREDPVGNRHAQVQRIVEDAMSPALSAMDGTTPVLVQIDMLRFHAVTERTRYTFGGEHEIEFTATVVDSITGAVLSGPNEVEITFRAYGGQQALDAEAVGITQRVRISDALDEWVRSEFPVPELGADQEPELVLASASAR